jgi:hypothetical protein
MPQQLIVLDPITLSWSEWYPFEFVSTNIRLIPKEPGVYEVIEPVKEHDNQCRLTIGETGNLRRRIRNQLIKGKGHSAGKDILINFEPAIRATLLVRWSLTGRIHITTHKCLPRFTDKT